VSGHGDSIRERRARESWTWSKWEEEVDEGVEGVVELDHKEVQEVLWQELLLSRLD
jgi:hypothetical protein